MTTISIQNQEHLEARQAELNATNDAFKATLTEEERAKYEAVGQAMRILTEAKVPVYMFPRLMSPLHDMPICYQYNNMMELTEFDSSGKQTDGARKFLWETHLSFYGAIFNWVVTSLNYKPVEFNWSEFSHRLLMMLDKGFRFNKDGK